MKVSVTSAGGGRETRGGVGHNRGLGDDIKVWLVEQPTLIAPFVGLRKTFHTISCKPPSDIIASKITLFLLTSLF